MIEQFDLLKEVFINHYSKFETIKIDFLFCSMTLNPFLLFIFIDRLIHLRIEMLSIQIFNILINSFIKKLIMDKEHHSKK